MQKHDDSFIIHLHILETKVNICLYYFSAFVIAILFLFKKRCNLKKIQFLFFLLSPFKVYYYTTVYIFYVKLNTDKRTILFYLRIKIGILANSSNDKCPQ